MKNKLVLLLFYLTLIFTLSAQPYSPFSRNVTDIHTVDSAYLCVYYAFNAINIHDESTYEDLQKLEIGNDLSKYYSYFLFIDDSLTTDWGKKHPHAATVPNHVGLKIKDPDTWSENHYSEYFKDFLHNQLTVYIQMPYPLGRVSSQYTEELPVQNWNISNDTLTVAGYLCQKATCSFRGRNYTAWFTMDIPVSNGPCKFGGLPGLILKVYDNDKLFTFECSKIENMSKKCAINKFNNFDKYKITERTNFLKFLKDVHENYYQMAQFIFPPGALIPKLKKYNLLELE